MKLILRIILAIIITALAFIVMSAVGWGVGALAHKIGFLPNLLEGDTFDAIVLDGFMVICMIGLVGCIISFIMIIAEELE